MLQVLPMAQMSSVLPTSPIIAQSFGVTDKGLLPWTLAAYGLTFGTFIVISGRLGDIFGHKHMVIIGFGWMSLWSIVAGLSVYSNYVLFLFARAFQGMGSALMQPNGLALLGRAYAPGSKKKNMIFALFGAMAPVGAYLGVTFGALFAQLVWWPWIFFAASVVCIILAFLASVILPSPPSTSTRTSLTKKLQDMDWLGAFSGIAALVCINIAWNCAPAQGWKTQYIFMLFILGLVLAAGFVLIETKVAQRPLVPFKNLRGDVGFVLSAVGFGWASFGIWLYYIWQFFLSIKRYTPLEAAVHFLPILPMGLIATGLTGLLMHSIRPAWILIVSMAAFTLGLILMTTVPATQTYWALTFISLSTIPFGMDMSFPAATVIMSNALPKDKQGMAGSLVSTVVNYSISLGLGFAATVEVNMNDGGRTAEGVLAGFQGAFGLGVGLGAIGLLVAIAFLLNELWQARRHLRAENHRQRTPKLNQFEQSPDEKETPSLRTWSSQTTLAQRDSRSISILPHYYGQPPLPSPRSSVWQMFEQEKEMV